MANYHFKKDLVIGEQGEKVVIQYLESKGAKLLNDNKDNKYDLQMQYKDKTLTYEVKTDVYCSPERDTGNLYIEFECRGKQSGVAVSQADWYVNYYPNLKTLWFIRMEDLKELISTQSFYICTQSGDAGSNTKGFLLPRNTYKDKFKVKHV